MKIEPQISAPDAIQEALRRAQQDRRAESLPAERATHLRLFFAWLPKILQDAPGIPCPRDVHAHKVHHPG